MTADASHDFDPELPILMEIEQQLRARATGGAERLRTERRGVDATHRREPGHGERRGVDAPDRREPGRDERRSARPQRRVRARARAGVVARRSSVLVALGLLVGATALATRSIVGEGRDAGDPSLRTTAPAPLGAGEGDGERWTLSAARRGDDVCDAFLVAGTVSTRCDTLPRAGAVMLDGVLSPRSRYIVGLAGADVRTVAVGPAGARRVVAAHPIHADAATRRARLPQRLRWFVVRLPRSARPGYEPPVRVTARDGNGRRLSAPQVSCSVGQATAACRRAAASG